MKKKIKEIVWNDETFYLPCPICVDLDEINKKFPAYDINGVALFLLMKSITEQIKRSKE